MGTKTLVTAALPYANGRIHLGHVAGAYLPADIYVRFLRLSGEECLFVCGTDEHGVPITITADQERTTPEEVVSRYHRLQDEAFRGLEIAFDVFSGTSTCRFHRELSQDFFSALHARGDVEPRETQQYFCARCRRFLPDRYVEGTCPHCGNPDARGDQCESCLRPLEELVDPHCKVCRATPERRPTRHWFFRLDRYAEPLRRWLAEKPHWRENVRRFAENFVAQGLRPRSITRDLPWGVPVPLPAADGAQGKVLYVWFDAPIGYVSFTRELLAGRGDPTGWERWWKDPETRVVHFIGKDNIVFHAVIWPAMLIGRGGYALPAEIPANEFLTLTAGKFSKSAGRGFRLDEALADWPADAIRWYLTAIAPETKDSAFAPEDLVARADEDLADVIGNFAQRSLAFVERYLGGKSPAESPSDELRGPARAARDETARALREFRFRDAQRAALEFAREGNRYVDRRAPWSTRKTDAAATGTTIATSLAAAEDLSVLLAPFVPGLARRLRAQLGLPGDALAGSWSRVGEGSGLPRGADLPKPAILVPKLAARRQEVPVSDPKPPEPPKVPAPVPASPSPPAAAATAGTVPPAAPAKIPIEAFRSVELRVARVVAAERVPKADKLLKLRITLGTEERQILAGIAQHYAPENLVGSEVVVVANLAPAKIRGEVSDGMLLAASDGDRVVVLRPETEVAPGSKVS
ncbi:MAG: methionine--tRNA ligase [Planctomycetales bacterium]|nr:methionine--tRNA ligase [Planctomycetales bacterium]